MLWKKKKIRKRVRTTEVNKIVTVVLKKDDISYADEAYQWNYGQILRIQGGNLPKVVEVHFSLEETSGTSVTRIGTTVDGVTEVPIPDSHLENNNCSKDYTIYAYIYLEDGTAGRTEYEIAIPVKARTKPEVPGTPEEPELFRETVKAVNDAADRAEQAEQNAKASEVEASKYATSASESADTAKKTKEDALKEVGEKKQEAIKAIQEQEETSAGEIINHTDDEIQRILNQTAGSKRELEQTIANASSSKEELDESIQTAGDTKTELDKSTELAGTAKTELDTSIREADEAKTALNGSAKTAGEMQETLSATVKQAGALDTSLGEKIKTGTQLKTDLVASGEKAVQDIQNAGSEQLDKMQAVAEEFAADREQITTNKENIGSLKEDIEKYFVEPINRLNLTTFTKKKKIDFSNGELIDATDLNTSDYIKIKKGKTYTSRHWYSHYGSTLRFPIYNTEKAFVESVVPTYVDKTNNTATFVAPCNGYTRICIHINDMTANNMFVDGATYPAEYILYSDIIHLSEDVHIKTDNIDNVENLTKGSMNKTEYCVEREKWKEPSHEVSATNKFISPTGVEETNGNSVYWSINISEGEHYRIKTNTGSNVRAYVIIRADGIVSRSCKEDPWGTIHDNDVEVTISSVENGGILYANTIDYNTLKVEKYVKESLIDGEKLLDDSIPTSKLKERDNILFGKIAIFDGDSICASGTDLSGKGSWAGRIGNRNSMIWHNYGVGGGTITNETYSGSNKRHWVCENIDKMYADYPNADYIIFEGGTNDADLLGDAITSAPERFGTFSLKDYSGNYDATTFCGALETMFFKAINYWATKKLGYIVAYKMGKSNNGYTKDVSNRRKYFDVAMQICDKWGIPYINLWDGCYMNPSLTVCYDSSLTSEENRLAGKLILDGQHPTPAGYDYITPMIEAWMRTL